MAEAALVLADAAVPGSAQPAELKVRAAADLVAAMPRAHRAASDEWAAFAPAPGCQDTPGAHRAAAPPIELRGWKWAM